MKIALLSGADPRNCKEGPVVRLLKGTWRLLVQGHDDSIVALHIDGIHFDQLKKEMVLLLPSHSSVQLHFQNRGKEKYITVVAEKIA